MEKCIGTPYARCNSEAKWLRSTQFSGDHPFCEKHAKEEEDFGETSSYVSWAKIKS